MNKTLKVHVEEALFALDLAEYLQQQMEMIEQKYGINLKIFRGKLGLVIRFIKPSDEMCFKYGLVVQGGEAVLWQMCEVPQYLPQLIDDRKSSMQVKQLLDSQYDDKGVDKFHNHEIINLQSFHQDLQSKFDDHTLRQLSFPTRHHNFEHMSPYLRHYLNNHGDSFQLYQDFYSLRTRQFEKQVIRWFSELYRSPNPEKIWGYMPSGSTENIASQDKTRDLPVEEIKNAQFDFSFEEVKSITTSIHKWIPSPFPSGQDYTLSTSRNGHAPLFTWDYLMNKTLKVHIDEALFALDLAEYLQQQMEIIEQKYGINLKIFRGKLGLVIRFIKPSDEICFKYGLLVQGGEAVVFIMPEKTKELCDNFIEDLKNDFVFKSKS
ncbi:UNKNOWN [Stylonychia lemnae]|uniref:Uncharacterized protein n=1 Tax=Stylonychia lemnae TaxID=5949 RepID=A0A077ZW60_STYLE|nr:UNKNOWN [Stylonychia lemnae]|eukprot:CDW73806.1 UNKNOWN [Stylonychia lemnae]